jgi:folate-dependent phosphoribosylglycinamide formyltransferase PurN
VNEPKRVAVLASGGGTNLQALIDHFNPAPAPAARVELVVASRPGVGALILAELEAHRIDLVVLAGYLQLVPIEIVERYHGRMLNVHPALLPAFGGQGMYGLRVHRAVIESGARVSGATVHLVSDRYDEGRIVAQWPVPVLPWDTPESLAERVLAVEHRILPMAVEAVATGEGPPPHVAGPLCFDLLEAPAPPWESIRVTLGEVR